MDQVTIQLDLPTSKQEVQLAIFDANGRQLQVLFQDKMEKGIHVFHWEGKAADGSPLSPGMYFLKMQTRGERILKKLIMVRD